MNSHGSFSAPASSVSFYIQPFHFELLGYPFLICLRAVRSRAIRYFQGTFLCEKWHIWSEGNLCAISIHCWYWNNFCQNDFVSKQSVDDGRACRKNWTWLLPNLLLCLYLSRLSDCHMPLSPLCLLCLMKGIGDYIVQREGRPTEVARRQTAKPWNYMYIPSPFLKPQGDWQVVYLPLNYINFTFLINTFKSGGELPTHQITQLHESFCQWWVFIIKICSRRKV